jgi:hypothetical protein
MIEIAGKKYADGTFVEDVKIVIDSSTPELDTNERSISFVLDVFDFKVIGGALYYREKGYEGFHLVSRDNARLQFILFRAFDSIVISHIAKANPQ